MMRWRVGLVAQLLVSVFLFSTTAHAQAQNCQLSQTQQAALLAEQLFGGQPSPGAVLVRRGYVTEYDSAHRVPRWSAWRVAPEYLGAPPRRGQWQTFRTDPDISNPVRDSDYSGVGSIDMARGHIVPYFISGGDRDGDGLKAANNQGARVDLDDACTIYEVNYLSNIAPQYQSRFNGSGGLWYELETRIREDIVGAGVSIHIIAGTVFGGAEIDQVGAGAIPVPHMFFQILIAPYGIVPFLFVHSAQIGPHGCALAAGLEDCIVAIADIETITGLDFFADLSDQDEAILQTPDGRAVWQVLVG